jgi:arylesterase/paraoxonase
MRRKLIAGAVLGIMVLAGGWFLSILWRAGSFRGIEPHFAGACRLVEGPVGPEDITIHPRTGIAYVSASDRRARAAGRATPGAIYAYDLNQPGAEPVNLTPDADLSFQPHGISLWSGGGRTDVLFVINHPASTSSTHAHTVEIFDVDGPALFHRATLADPLLVMPNDLVAVGVDRFYLTNTHRHPPRVLQTIETYLQRPGAQLLYYGEGGFRVAVGDLVFPNGVNVSPDGRSLYLALVTPRSLRVYDRDPASERLSHRRDIFLGSGPDNIEIDASGGVWVAAHPQLLRVGRHGNDPAKLSPSQVLRIDPESTVEEIYLNRGEEISAASVAAVSGSRLLIGQIFGDGFLDCEMGPGS